MTKEQYLNLKQELKDLAVKIRESKNGFREDQREFSKCQKENGTANDYYEGKINSEVWEKIQPEYSKLNKKQYESMIDLHKIRSEYRYKHIVYCFARGRTMKEIEPKVRKDNEIDLHELQRLMKIHDVREPLVLEVSA